jgi:hypothetical protein
MENVSLKEAIVHALSKFPDLPLDYCSRFKVLLFTSSGIFCGTLAKQTKLESETGKIVFSPAFTLKEIVDYLVDCGVSVYEKGFEETPSSPHTRDGFIVLEDAALLSNDLKFKIKDMESVVVFVDQIAAISLCTVE